MKRAAAMAALSSALLLAACGEDRSAGGSVETENVYAISVDSLLPPWNHPVTYATVASVTLDASNFPFERSTSDGRDVAVETPAGARIAFEKTYWDSAARMARLRVRFDTGSLVRGARVLLRWGLARGADPDPVATWKGISQSQRLAIMSVPVDDFEQGTLQSLVPGGGNWYVSTSDSIAKVSQPELVAAGKGRSGTVLHISYDASISNYRYALTGVSLGPVPRSLRSLDSLVFWARGSGTLSVAFDRLIPGRTGKAWVHKTLDSTWTRYAIRPQDLLDSSNTIGGNLGWKAVRDSITNFTLLVAGGKDLWVDDIRFHGPEWEDFR